MKKILFLFLLMCSVSASAQDVIVKKDGSTIVCRIVEVTQTEVIYKKWTDLQGSNYVMERANVSAINYEDGKKTSFGDTPATTTQTPTSISTNAQQQQMSDDMLMRMAGGKLELSPIESKIKRLKRTGWICGGLLSIAGISLTWAGIGQDDPDDSPAPLLGSGLPMLIGGLTVASACFIRANKLKHSQYSVYSSPIFQQNFNLKNGASLATGIDFMQDNTHRNPMLGLGLSYHF